MEKPSRAANDTARELDTGIEDFGNRFNRPLISTGENLELNLGIAKLSVLPEKGLRELLATGKEFVTIPHAEVPFRIEEEKSRYMEELTRVELEAKFDTLYANLGDDAANAFSQKLQQLIDTVKITTPKLDVIEECVDEVESKECK